jgi:hypothetical protein
MTDSHNNTMQTDNQSTEGKDLQQTEDESSLDGAACSPSSSRRLRRFTPKEMDDFQKARASRPEPVWEREDTPHIVFPKGARFISDFPMTHEEIKAVSDLMFAGKKSREASDRLRELLPVEVHFYGNWDRLIISNREP